MKYLFFLTLLITVWLKSTAQDVSTAKYMHITVDGDDSEWGSLNLYDDETQLNFAIANDSNNIYLCFATASQAAEMKLMRAGMKITLTTKGKPKHEASIQYPLMQTKQPDVKSPTDNKSMNDSSERPVFNKETFRQSYIAHHATMQVDGFTNINGEVPVKNAAVQAAINWDTASNLIYEVAISKKEFFGAGYTPKDDKNDITLNVELNGIPHSETGDAKSGGYHEGNTSSGDANGEGGTHGGGGEMHGGGGMHGGGMHGGSGGGFNGASEKYADAQNTLMHPNSASLNTKTSFKQKFILNDGNE
jgi:hypothetical protein